MALVVPHEHTCVSVLKKVKFLENFVLSAVEPFPPLFFLKGRRIAVPAAKAQLMGASKKAAFLFLVENRILWSPEILRMKMKGDAELIDSRSCFL